MMKGEMLRAALRAAGDSDVHLTKDVAGVLVDAVDEADGSYRDLIESECLWVENPGATVEGDGWWDTLTFHDGTGGTFKVDPMAGHRYFVGKALSYLDRRGLIERKEGEPHMVRFIET